MNQGVHTVDLLLWLLGQPVEVYAHTGALAHERIEVEDVAVATVRFASGALAVLHATTAAYPGLAVRLQVHGTARLRGHPRRPARVLPRGDADGRGRPRGGAAATRRPTSCRRRAARRRRRRRTRSSSATCASTTTSSTRSTSGRPPGVTACDEALLALAVVQGPLRLGHARPAGRGRRRARRRRTTTCRRRPGSERMKFSVFTASTPEWTPAEAAADPGRAGLGRRRVAGHRPGRRADRPASGPATGPPGR